MDPLARNVLLCYWAVFFPDVPPFLSLARVFFLPLSVCVPKDLCFVYLFTAALGLCWCGEQGLLFVVCSGFPLRAQTVKRLPTMRETRLWSLGQEDPLEKEMATHSSILAWKIPWIEERDRLQPTVHGVEKSRTRLSDFTFTLQLLVTRVENVSYDIQCYFWWETLVAEKSFTCKWQKTQLKLV